MNAKVTTTSVEQTANEVLGTATKKLYYLIVETAKGKTVINVGQKTHDTVMELTKVITKMQIDEPLKPEQAKK